MTRHEAMCQPSPPCPHRRVKRKQTRTGVYYSACSRCGLIFVARFAAATLIPLPHFTRSDIDAAIALSKEPE